MQSQTVHTENPDAAQAIKADLASLESRMVLSQDNRTLRYGRRFSFGTNQVLVFPVTSYASLKRVLDAVHEHDAHTLTLKGADDGPK